MEGENMRIRPSLFMVKLALLEGFTVIGLSHCKFGMRVRNTRKLIEKFSATLLNQSGQFAVMIRKIKEWRRCAIFLTLKQHRRARHEEQQRRNCPVPAGGRQLVKT